ncbi:threonine/serine ThrE exporter family protein [Mycolicibacterium holsaticum]|uniref:threonine/serine ThrE exporter family protein n=1 Tax=Mycolicibacterium holsaticum TaxID=152142 RepID=UPI001C7C9FC1|nr:threonine/serine exporter family protein [Mycolicibacterium holsaticum]QZA15016.1 threonine/serine exporter family protein [Mycolicibacterium holsaticum DSM 44478 = JCM 12374]UNC07547.1 threonine/serine exporter family protein [Mycolicibacterium holsaticum DSM 44478 = JCM 12374]
MSGQRIGYVARLGAAMAASNYPVTMVRQMIERCSSSYGLDASFIALPNHVQVVGPATESGSVVKAAQIGRDLRFDQAFPLAGLVSDTLHGRVDPIAGEARLDRIEALPPPYPSWVTVLGYGVWSAGLALVLEPTPLNVLVAGVLGVMVGLFWVAGQRIPELAYLVPVISAFAVTAICIVGARYLEFDHVGLRALIPPLAMFLPGAAITLAVIELTSRDVISGSSRLIAGFVQIVQLAFGIVIAAQVFGLDESQLSPEAINKIGPWAPWLGVVVYALGVMLFLAPPRSFLPWLVSISAIAYAAQFLGDLLFGSYASGFCGGLALSVAALAMSRLRPAPPAITMILPGFWLLVPGSMGLIGVAEIFGADGDDALPATLISMISVALGLQAGLVLWRVIRRQPAR